MDVSQLLIGVQLMGHQWAASGIGRHKLNNKVLLNSATKKSNKKENVYFPVTNSNLKNTLG